MEKYYTPSLEEIHVGLECEWQSKIRGDFWEKQVFDIDLVSIAHDALEHSDMEEPFEEQFRVKYLDESDLIELGWVKDNGYFKIVEECYDEEGLTGIKYEITFYNNMIYIYEGDNYIFKGQVKNKTEMKKLMQMLNIKPPKPN